MHRDASPPCVVLLNFTRSLANVGVRATCEGLAGGKSDSDATRMRRRGCDLDETRMRRRGCDLDETRMRIGFDSDATRIRGVAECRAGTPKGHGLYSYICYII